MTLVDEIAQMIRVESNKTGAGALAEKIYDRILSDPSIVEIEVDAELPKWKMAKERDEFGNAVYRLAQQDMVDANWVKKKGK